MLLYYFSSLKTLIGHCFQFFRVGTRLPYLLYSYCQPILCSLRHSYNLTFREIGGSLYKLHFFENYFLHYTRMYCFLSLTFRISNLISSIHSEVSAFFKSFISYLLTHFLSYLKFYQNPYLHHITHGSRHQLIHSVYILATSMHL